MRSMVVTQFLCPYLLYDYKQLTECISEVERIESKVNSKKKDWSTMKNKDEGEKQVEREGTPTTLDGYFIQNNANYK